MLYKKGEIFGRLANTKEDGGGRYWSGKHTHLWDTSMLYGHNPTWMVNTFGINVTLGWGANYGNLYGPGTNFPNGHPGIDGYTNDGYLRAPFDLEVYEEWVDPNGGSTKDTSNLVCKNANGLGGVFGFEHCRIVEKKKEVKHMDVKFTGRLPYQPWGKEVAGYTDNGWYARIMPMAFSKDWYIVEFKFGVFTMSAKDINSNLCWPA